jgi:CRISPR/Cas system CMR subunit Cmr6 (Cas7 group RAMP superfamily)
MPERPFDTDSESLPREPKPFGKLGFVKEKSLGDIIGHNEFSNTYTGTLTCTLAALTPLHVGSGIYDIQGDRIIRGLVTAGGKVIIPGTSIKGVVRSIAEAISPSCVRILNSKTKVERNLSVPALSRCADIKPRDRKAKLCVSCSMFGALGYQGRIGFDDASLIRGGVSVHSIQSPYPPNERGSRYKDAKGLFDGRKFYYHGEPVDSETGEPYQVIREDSEFRFLMNFESLTPEELCLVLAAMGILDNIVIKMGGGKQAMLGSVEIFVDKLEMRDSKASFEDFSGGTRIIEGDNVQAFFDEIGAASSLVNEDALDELAAIWQHPSSRKAPTGVY